MDKMKTTWKNFIMTGEVAENTTRPEILESWKRCRSQNVFPFHKKCPVVLSPEELEKKLADNIDLMEIARTVIRNIYKFVAGSGFVVMLCDSDGYILERAGDEERLNSIANARVVEGACFSENVLGTNAIGTSIVLDKPIQVYAYEHWTLCTQIGTCSASPIHDPINGKIIGCLDMTGQREKVNPHTLGMVVAGAGAVESLMKSQFNYRKAILADEYKALIMESTSDGLVTTDNEGIITHINGRARKFLGLKENPTGQDINSIFKSSFDRLEIYKEFLRLVESKEKIHDEFIEIQLPSGLFRLMGSGQCILENKNIVGRVVVLQDISRINRLVNKVIGKQAKTSFNDLVSRNKKFMECIDIANYAAKSTSNILLLGESGTGKELFAQSIHNASQRCDKPFIAINCGAIPRELLSSELFGYAGGAFTGAQKGGAPGKFEIANGGTIFLDEIGDMPLEMQAALLRVIEEKAITRVGSGKVVSVDVRVIAATNKDLLREIGLRNFRSDLYYRLNVISIKLAPLRERKDDIPLLIETFVKKLATNMGKVIEIIEPDFIDCCTSYDWPGNVRELNNIIERAVSLTRNTSLSVNNLPSHLTGSINEKNDDVPESGKDILKISSHDAERSVIARHLEKCKNNRSMVAEKLGISRSTLYRKLKDLELTDWH